MQKNKYLNLYYDKEADVLYFSKGTPSSKDVSDEVADEVVMRRNPDSREITGFTILNFSKKSKKANQSLQLPFEVNLQQSAFI